MVGLIKENKVYFKLDELIDRSFIICFGVTAVEGYESTKFYAHNGEPDPIIKFSLDPTNAKQCQLTISYNPHVWSGVPIIVDIIEIDGINYLDVTAWLSTHLYHILITAYSMFLSPDSDQFEKLQKYETIYGNFYQIKNLPHGIQVVGSVKAGKPSNKTDYSVNLVINLYESPDQLMVGRVADSRIGYFYHNFKIGVQSYLTGNPIALINRLNLDKQPWTYIIDHSIPHQYHQFVKSGVTSWNKYFDKLGLGQPFKVIGHGDPDYPTEIDVFDMNAWYIVGTTANKFNGPYSGFSMNIADIRSGEILFGMISMNLIKIISNPTRYLVMNGQDPSATDQFKEYIQQYISWVATHEIGHQLGLRHNFMGVFQTDHVSTVMDYVDVFNDLTTLNTSNPWGTLREYDLLAVEYGYIKLEGERTGIKHPLLDAIADQLEYPFGTDENYMEAINPLVNAAEDNNDPLSFVEQMIPIYRKYRTNLINFIKNKAITPYEYNTMFLYLYTQNILN